MNSDWPAWAHDLPEPLQRKFIGTAAWQWLALLALIAGALAGYWIGRAIARRLTRLKDKIGGAPLTPPTAMAFRRAIGALFAIGITYPWVSEIALHGKTLVATENVFAAGSIIAAALMVRAIWEAICDDIVARSAGALKTERLLVPMARKLVQAVILVVSILVASSLVFGADIRGIVASLGIGGLVVALAAKDSVENLFGSLTILFDMPFAIGDWIRIDKIEGIVEEINLRSTRIRTFEDSVIHLPNANLIRASVENVSDRRARRQQLSVRISYDTKADAVDAFCADLREWLEKHDKVVADKTIVQISDMSETSLGVLVQCQFEVKSQAEELAMRHDLATEILRVRDKRKVLFAAAPRPADPAQTAAQTSVQTPDQTPIQPQTQTPTPKPTPKST